ncbi:hypothetical protein L615_006600000130 [Nocardioides sp. J9]|uniref:hypothetical protein n=1 Tax=Nocardioides sp. J9 TaxID=935844 RepID=UPI0011A87712|nr:hypothetical protein [Nocardioides sp. J9]TWG93054.1 hypothetical protein L615_006600000130 [Nocardioides sp. J9]
MTALQHFAEPYAPQGNIDARAADRAIGRPQLDPWDVFLRETVQNSWDARLEPHGPVRYSVDAFWPSPDRVQILKETVFAELPESSDLAAFLSGGEDTQPFLVVTDTGTKGLGGPTRADRVTSDATDFIDFVRNVGRAADKKLGGGTYGFGKGTLWGMSSCATVLIYTKSTYQGAPVSRFIAMGHTDPYSDGALKYTGRHWWGRSDPDTLIEPVEGVEADELAESLGMSRLRDEATGTSLMVLGPVATDTAETVEAVVRRLASAALWWAWPHMVDGSIRFEFTADGADVPVQLPDDHPCLRHFAEAYRRAKSTTEPVEDWPWNQDVLRMQRPALRLGALAWRRVPREDLAAAPDSPVQISSHVALMRRPRLIVRYLPVREDPNGQGTAGVFVADDDLNDKFAKAEPVAHDDWSASNMGLPKGTRNPVKRALELIKESFVSAAVNVGAGDGTVVQPGLVRLATAMGDLVLGTGDAAFVREKSSSPSGGGSRSLSAKVIGSPRLELFGGRAAARFEVEVNVPSSSALPVRVSVDPHVLTETGPDRDQDLAQPEVLDLELREAMDPARRGVLVTQAGKQSFQVVVSVPDDTAVAIAVSAAAEVE